MTITGATSKNFTHHEMRCPCCGENRMQQGYLDRLQLLRDIYNAPMIVTSAYRCPKHNQEVSTTGPAGPHTTGRAVDILVYGHRAHRLLELAFHFGFTGIGIKQHGAHETRIVHLDDLPNSPTCPRPWVWTYP